MSGLTRPISNGGGRWRVSQNLGAAFVKPLLQKCSHYAGNRGFWKPEPFALRALFAAFLLKNLNSLPGAAVSCLHLLQSGKTAEREREKCLRWLDNEGRCLLKQLMLIAEKN